MKLTKKQIIRCAEISALDADIRKAEWNKHRTLFPKTENYDFSAIKELFPDANFFQIDCVEGLYGQIDDFLFINFRGSDSLADWARNFMFSQKEVPYDNMSSDIKIHHGFIKDYKKVRDMIHAVVKANPSKKVIVYGHSMGAALSAICSLDLQYNFPDKEIGVFVIGMPRIGNKAFKTSFEKRMPDFIRCTYRNDVVPQIPPKSFGFEELDQFIQLGGPRTQKVGTMKDHDWHKYLEALKIELPEDKE